MSFKLSMHLEEKERFYLFKFEETSDRSGKKSTITLLGADCCYHMVKSGFHFYP